MSYLKNPLIADQIFFTIEYDPENVATFHITAENGNLKLCE